MPGFHFVHTGSGKNATDIVICLDSMERALSGQCEAVLLASSDQDFTHLATRLRGYGVTVIGMGEAKTAERFRAACSIFHLIETGAKPITSMAVKPVCVATVSELDQTIRNVIRSNCKDATGLEITKLSSSMYTIHDIRISALSDKTWRAYLTKRPDLFDLDPKGPNAKVRYKPAGFGAISA